jgi:hypothetical protein
LNKGLSPAFPVTGMDNLGSQANITGGKYPPAGVITDGFGSTLLINNKGILELLLKAISTNHYRWKRKKTCDVHRSKLLSYSMQILLR